MTIPCPTCDGIGYFHGDIIVSGCTPNGYEHIGCNDCEKGRMTVRTIKTRKSLEHKPRLYLAYIELSGGRSLQGHCCRTGRRARNSLMKTLRRTGVIE